MAGFPRKNDELRLYKDKKQKGVYFMLLVCNGFGRGGYDAIANAYTGASPSLCGTSISPNFLARTWPKRIEWRELPEEWKAAFAAYLSEDDEPFQPEKYRGLWRVGNQPAATAAKGS
jgi:hypothetical protein